MSDCKHDDINKVNYSSDDDYYCHDCKNHISYGEYVTALENKIERLENNNFEPVVSPEGGIGGSGVGDG